MGFADKVKQVMGNVHEISTSHAKKHLAVKKSDDNGRPTV